MKKIEDISREERQQLVRIARRVVWWKSPEEALKSPLHFLAHVMTYGYWEDWVAVREILGDTVFETVLDNPPTGVFDKKSWHYWHTVHGRKIPALPEREIPA